MFLHALVRGIIDEEIREQVLVKTEEMGLDETVKFVEAKETGHLVTLASTEVSRITAYKREQKNYALLKPPDVPRDAIKCRF